MQIYPMSFYEYLNAIRGESLAEESLKHPGTVDERVQNMLLEELRRYFFIGGMPECVKTFSESGSMLETFRVQSEIMESYRDDFSKYKPHVDPACLDAVFLNCAKSVGDQLIYTKLNDGHTGQTNRKAFDLLCKAGVLTKIPSANPSGLPLGATANQKKLNCPRGLVLYDGTYKTLPEQKLEYLPLYSAGGMSGETEPTSASP